MKKLGPICARYLPLFALCAAAAVVLPTCDLSDDIMYWVNWATYMRGEGFVNAYELLDNNYNPLFQYLLLLYLQLVDATSIGQHIYVLKLFTLFFDFGAVVVAMAWVAGQRRHWATALLLLGNAGYLYNTLVWGQVDAIYTGLLFLAIVLSLRERPIWSALCYVLALNAKLQALLLLPVLVLLWLPQWARAPRLLPRALAAALGVQLLLVLPFLLAHGPGYLARINLNTFGSIDYYPVVSMFCYNFWHLALWHEPHLNEIPDTSRLAGVTYRHWGMALFLLASVPLLWPLLLTSVRQCLARQRFRPADYALLFLTAGLVPVLFSYFNTQMHSRYVHASILLLGCYALVSRRYLLFGLASTAYFLNLSSIINVFAYYHLKLAWNPQFNPRFIAGLYTLVVLGGFCELYRCYSPGPVLAALFRWWRWPRLAVARTQQAREQVVPSRSA